jgi:glutamyl-tRNA synthetase
MQDQVQGAWCSRPRTSTISCILRSDGTPTYMLAVVVDDHDMGVTHIIRGDDHLTNAARQIADLQRHGLDRAGDVAHIPLIHGPDGAKLSKRHGALGVEAYRADGLSAGGHAQLPGPARLEPWRRARFLDAQMVEWFSLEALNARGALRFRQAREPQRPLYPRGTPALLPSYEVCWNGHRAQACSAARRLDREQGCGAHAALPELQRAKTVLELIDLAQFIYAAPARQSTRRRRIKLLTPDARAQCRRPSPKSLEASTTGPRKPSMPRCGLRRAARPEARQGGPAAARRADRAHRFAGHFRRAWC